MKSIGLIITLAMMILSNCVIRPTSGPVRLIYPEDRPVEIELKSYSFQPNHIAILQSQSPLTFRLTNTASMRHNFTLIDSLKNVLVTKDVKPKGSITVTLEPLSPGNYTFYCNRFLHRLGGMKGMLMLD
jgi:plastocyanin